MDKENWQKKHEQPFLATFFQKIKINPDIWIPLTCREGCRALTMGCDNGYVALWKLKPRTEDTYQLRMVFIYLCKSVLANAHGPLFFLPLFFCASMRESRKVLCYFVDIFSSIPQFIGLSVVWNQDVFIGRL